MSFTKTQNRAAVIAIVTFIVAYLSRTIVFSIPFYVDLYRAAPELLQDLEQPLRWFLIIGVGLYIAHRHGLWRMLDELAVFTNPLTGLAVGVVGTAPMWLIPLISGSFAEDLSLYSLLFFCVIWPFAEEIVFRGYFFRQLHRRAGWNLWAAAIISGLIFGLVHLANASVQNLPLSEQWGTVAMLGVLNIGLAWVFARWDDNLWVAVSIHGLMNLWWNVFELAGNPLGGFGANLMRLGSALIIVILTLNRTRLLHALRLRPHTA